MRRACIRVNHILGGDTWRGRCGWPNFCKTAGAADSPPVCGILVVALRVVAVIVGSIDARHPSSHIIRVLGKSVAFLDATALCRGVAAGERENPFVSWVSAAVNVNTTKAHESISPRLRLTPRQRSTFVNGRNAHLIVSIFRYASPLSPSVFVFHPFWHTLVYLSSSLFSFSLSLSLFLLFLSLSLSIFLYELQYAQIPIYRYIANVTTLMCVASGPIVDDT